MADEATDVQVPSEVPSEITLDDFTADEQESPKAAPSTVEETKPDTAKAEVAAEETVKPESEAPTETEGEAKPADETNPEKPQTKADERKTELNTEIRDLVSQRNALRTEVAKANAEVYQPATEQDLVDEGMTATNAKVEALRQQVEMRDYNERVAEAQLTVESEANRVLRDFDWANPDSPDYKEDLATQASALLQQNLDTDPNTGQIIGSRISPYQLYKTLDTATNLSAVQGQLKGQQATETMLANADTAGSVAPPKKTEDPLVALWKSDD